MQDTVNAAQISDVIWALSLLLALTIIGFTIIGSIAFYRSQKGQAVSFGLMFRRGNFLRIGTVVLVVVAVIFLSLLGKLTEASAAILSGVAGYVLGGMEKAEQSRPKGKNGDEENP